MANATPKRDDRQGHIARHTFVTETNPVPTVVCVRSLEREPGKPCNARQQLPHPFDGIEQALSHIVAFAARTVAGPLCLVACS